MWIKFHCQKDSPFIDKYIAGASTYCYADSVSFFLLQVKFAIQYMRRTIQKKAKFDIADLNTIKVFFPSFLLLLFVYSFFIKGSLIKEITITSLFLWNDWLVQHKKVIS
jgi:hypothetical protein